MNNNKIDLSPLLVVLVVPGFIFTVCVIMTIITFLGALF